MKGIFITFEGIDGSGKTTQIELLNSFLKQSGFDVVLTREPGGTDIGDKIRKILLDSKNIQMSYRAETLLFLASRAELVSKVIQPSLNQGKIIICDRFFDSTIAYQGIARQLGAEKILDMSLWATENIIPDLTFLLSIDVWECENRIKNGKKKKDRIEKEEIDFKSKIQEGYMQLAGKNKERFVIVDGCLDIESVFAVVKSNTLRVLKSKGLL
ncbi:MAG: dTMP kinase [Actinobacteria bacterium]|nr:dTMP kinase [Actinomycetota bacterium]MBE3094386.1 dTMP kinase [Actinomycetota bacterium]